MNQLDFFSWRLNNYLLEARVVKEEMLGKIRDFFEGNQGSADDIVVCETFNVYVQGTFISLSVARKKAKSLVREELQEIKDLDQEHKSSGTQTAWATLKEKTDQLKLLAAHEVAKDSVCKTKVILL